MFFDVLFFLLLSPAGPGHRCYLAMSRAIHLSNSSTMLANLHATSSHKAVVETKSRDVEMYRIQIQIQMVLHISKCIKLYKLLFEYDMTVGFGVKFDIFGFGYLGRIVGLEYLCDKNRFFKSCFKQSTEGKITAQRKT